MPRLSRYFIKAGLIYFVIAQAVGLLMLIQPDPFGRLRPVYLHLLMVGWITQLIIGVAYWMFPKQSKEHPRGSEKLGWMIFITLNAGLLLRTIGEPLLTLQSQVNVGGLLAVAALLQLVAGWAFIANTWTRVKER
jgi:cbb3-type cytochrome oxidase subunit 1